MWFALLFGCTGMEKEPTISIGDRLFSLYEGEFWNLPLSIEFAIRKVST